MKGRDPRQCWINREFDDRWQITRNSRKGVPSQRTRPLKSSIEAPLRGSRGYCVDLEVLC